MCAYRQIIRLLFAMHLVIGKERADRPDRILPAMPEGTGGDPRESKGGGHE